MDVRASIGEQDRVHEAVEIDFGVLIVDADAAFDRDGGIGRIAHGREAIGDQTGLGHEARAKLARLHAIGRAPDIEIDLVVTEPVANPDGGGKFCRIGAAQLDRDRMLTRIISQQPPGIPMHQRSAGHHLGEQQRGDDNRRWRNRQ